jgi:uncharacterized membrane protein YdbT with pleckstrin-like domain
MHNPLRRLLERTLRIPSQPGPPPGDEKSTRIFNAAPNFYKYLLLVWAFRTAGLFLGAFPTVIGLPVFIGEAIPDFGVEDLFSDIPLVGIALLLAWRLIALALVSLDFEKRWYLVTDRSLRVREGVVNVREMTITFANIQNVSISQGPIQRLLGIADLQVDAAGGGPKRGDKKREESSHTVRFRGVNNAGEIRTLIMVRQGELKDSGLGDRDEAVAAKPPSTSSREPEVVRVLRELAAEASALRKTVEIAV